MLAVYVVPVPESAVASQRRHQIERGIAAPPRRPLPAKGAPNSQAWLGSASDRPHVEGSRHFSFGSETGFLLLRPSAPPIFAGGRHSRLSRAIFFRALRFNIESSAGDLS